LNTNLLYGGLFGKTRQAVLALIYGHADSSFYTKQVLDAVKGGRGAVQRELKNLTDTGIVKRTVSGRQVYYQANPDSPVFNELKGLITRVSSVHQPRFTISRGRLAEFCRRHHIVKLSLFGSVLRPDFRPDSDIDVLVEFEPGYTPGFAIIAMENELSKILGRRVDLRTPKDLSRYFREQVVREAQVQYAAK